jgi:hypothetical protein
MKDSLLSWLLSSAKHGIPAEIASFALGWFFSFSPFFFRPSSVNRAVPVAQAVKQKCVYPSRSPLRNSLPYSIAVGRTSIEKKRRKSTARG